MSIKGCTQLDPNGMLTTPCNVATHDPNDMPSTAVWPHFTPMVEVMLHLAIQDPNGRGCSLAMHDPSGGVSSAL